VLLDISRGGPFVPQHPAATPASDAEFYMPLDPDTTYLVATTDFQAKIAPGYSDIFKQSAAVEDTGIIVNDLMMQTIRDTSPISAHLDGRIQ
jgi:hypothetical protein